MDEEPRKQKTLKELVEESPFWEAEELMHNLDVEIDRMERGFGHMVWVDSSRPVSICLPLLPITPRFKIKESEGKFGVAVELPNVPEDLMRVNVDRTGIEISACTSDPVCRPYYVKIESNVPLNPDTVQLKHTGTTLEVNAEKIKRKRVNVR